MRITFSCDEQEAADLRRLAQASGLTVSALVRQSLRATYGVGGVEEDP